jgi:hypothetical protein
LAERCVKAGTRPGDTVLDPFIGAGTTALVADRLQRDCIGIDLNTGYTEMAMERCRQDAPLFTSSPPAEDPEDTRMADLFTDMAATERWILHLLAADVAGDRVPRRRLLGDHTRATQRAAVQRRLGCLSSFVRPAGLWVHHPWLT